MFEPQNFAQAWLTVKDFARQWHRHYVYILMSLDGLELFYIGKGSGYRFKNHTDKWGVSLVLFYAFCLDEETAYKLEDEAIALGRFEGWSLKNKMGGGVKTSYRLTPEQQQKALARSNSSENRESKRQKALLQWATRREEMTEAIRRTCQTDEFRAKMSNCVPLEVRSRASKIRWAKEKSRAL